MVESGVLIILQLLQSAREAAAAAWFNNLPIPLPSTNAEATLRYHTEFLLVTLFDSLAIGPVVTLERSPTFLRLESGSSEVGREGRWWRWCGLCELTDGLSCEMDGFSLARHEEGWGGHWG